MLFVVQCVVLVFVPIAVSVAMSGASFFAMSDACYCAMSGAGLFAYCCFCCRVWGQIFCLFPVIVLCPVMVFLLIACSVAVSSASFCAMSVAMSSAVVIYRYGI